MSIKWAGHHALFIGTMLLTTVDWSTWVRGLLAAFIGGGAGAVSAAIAMPTVNILQGSQMDLPKFFWTVLAVFIISAVIHVMAFLAKDPLPAMKTTTTTTTETTQSAPGLGLDVKTHSMQEVVVVKEPVAPPDKPVV